MNTIKSSYIGLFKQPVDGKLKSTIYCITDRMKDRLIMIILTPSAFIDAYNISKRLTYTEIYYVVPSLDVLFVSDLFNIFMKIKTLKPYAKWIFPEKPDFQTSVEFELNQIVADHFMYDGYNDYNFNVSLEFILSQDEGRKFYDILLNDGKKSIYFSQYMDADKLEKLYDDDTIDEIHIPYSSTLYGGLTYHQIMKISNKYYTKIRVHSFLTVEEYNFCREMNRVKIGEVRYSDFI